VPETLFIIARAMATDDPSSRDRRLLWTCKFILAPIFEAGFQPGRPSKIGKAAVILSLVIMAAAGHFVRGLRWDGQKGGVIRGSRHCLRDTNLDVITAETIIWIHFLMMEFLKAEDHEILEWIGYGTSPNALELTLGVIERETGFDFKAQGVEFFWSRY
jgi:hypothetical protein